MTQQLSDEEWDDLVGLIAVSPRDADSAVANPLTPLVNGHRQ